MFSIDWISYTVKGEGAFDLREKVWLDDYGCLDKYDLVREVAPWFGGNTWIMSDSGLFGYDRGMQTSEGARVMWHTERHGMGIHAVLPGSALEGVNTLDVLAYVVAIGGEVTRLDICYDDKSINCTKVDDYVRRYEGGYYVGRRRKYSEIKNGDGGHTLYIGARQSDRFMRIYDKAAERGVDGNWIRVELELKGDAARGASKWLSFYEYELSAGEIDFSGLINAFVEFPGTSAWLDMRGSPVTFPASEKGSRATAEWALGAVGTQAKLIKMDQGFEDRLVDVFREHGIVIQVVLVKRD